MTPTAYPYDGLCSLVGTAMKQLFQDDQYLSDDSKFSRITIKFRAMGTNTWISVGGHASQFKRSSEIPQFRFTTAGQSHTFIAPSHNGQLLPLKAGDFLTIGDGATGIIEITGIGVDGI